MINKSIIILKFIPGKVITLDITSKKIINIAVAKVVMIYEKQKSQLIKIYGHIKILLTLSDFATPCL